MADKFHRFPELPKELRLQIWEQTMFEARPDRRIILYKSRVVPFKEFISPLLLVNYESRTCAKAFYNAKLDIYAVPRLSDHQLKSLDKKNRWAQIRGSDRAVDGQIYGYTDGWTYRYFLDQRFDIYHGIVDGELDNDLLNSDSLKEKELERIDREEKEYTVDLESHWSEYVEERLRVFGGKSAVKAEKSGPTKGAFYISPEHDVFIDGHECGVHFHIENASAIFGANFPEPQRRACHHISAKLPAATRKRVSTLVLVRPQDVKLLSSHCVFAVDADIDYIHHPLAFCDFHIETWQQKSFPCVRSYFRLRPDFYNRSDFLQQLIDADGPQISQILEQWVRHESSVDQSGQIVLEFGRTKGPENSPFFEKADWVRDLMADCDTSK